MNIKLSHNNHELSKELNEINFIWLKRIILNLFYLSMFLGYCLFFSFKFHNFVASSSIVLNKIK